MEANIKKEVGNPIHIEFYGLPGCGKSTVSHCLAEKLRAEGYKVFEPTYEMDHELNPIARRITKLIFTIRFAIFYHKNFVSIKTMIRKNGYTKKCEIIGQLVNIAPKCYKYESSKKAIYIWDEGLIQSAISLVFKNHHSAINECITTFQKKYDMIPIYLCLDIQTALERMDNRSSNDSRVEKESDIGIKNRMMRSYENIIRKIKLDNGIMILANEYSEELILQHLKSII